MEQVSMGDILDQTVKRKATRAEIYIVRAGRKVLYVGQSASVYDRLEAHLGLDWRADRSYLGRYVFEHLPHSRRWTVSLYSLHELEKIVVPWFRKQGADWYTSAIYRARADRTLLCNLRWRHVIRRTEGVQPDIMSGKGDKQRHVLLSESSWNVLSAIREGASADDYVNGTYNLSSKLLAAAAT